MAKKKKTTTKAEAIELAQAQLRDSVKKRIGRPTKKPTPGERVPLGLRVTPQMKGRLERAALRKGRSLSQEVEFRLEQSLAVERNMLLSKGGSWSPILFAGNKLIIYVGEEEVIALDITPDEKHKLLDHFRDDLFDEYPPYDPEDIPEYDPPTDEEIEAAGEQWLEQREEIKRGK